MSRAPEARPPPLGAIGSNYNEPFQSPNSPLSQLVQQGYQNISPVNGSGFGMQAYQQRPGSRSRPGSRQDGFDAGVAQQWSNNVQQNLKAYQQQNDPTFSGAKKPTGYRVTQAPGGGSSINLSWGGEEPPARGRINQAPSPVYAAPPAVPSMRSSSPGSAMRSAAPSNQSYRSSNGGVSAPPFGVSYEGNGFGGGCPPPLPSRAQVSYHQDNHSGLVFGARNDVCSSNAYATGSNQNCGNFITDRRTTRVLAPPGGSSSIQFG